MSSSLILVSSSSSSVKVQLIVQFLVWFGLIITACCDGQQEPQQQEYQLKEQNRRKNVAAVVAVDDCTLNCPTGIGCVMGSVLDHPGVLFDDTTNTNGGFWNGIHCACPAGTTGLMCEVPYKSCVPSDTVDSSTSSSTSSGNNDDDNDDIVHKCYNGGKCIIGQLTDYFGNDQMYCDCTDAIDTVQKIQYVGKYCQHAVLLAGSSTGTTSNIVPDETNSSKTTTGVVEGEGGSIDDTKVTLEVESANTCLENPSLFCLNGGTCNEKYPVYGAPCLCSKGYNGQRCEYIDGTVPNCTLTCKNGGVCVLGKMTTPKFEPFWYGASSDTNVDGINDLDTMHCDCPDTHDGPFCEIDRVPCGATTTSSNQQQQSYCYYGSECVSRIDPKNSSNILRTCDCSDANTAEIAYAGLYCQYEANMYCTRTDTTDRYYCVNGGKCSTTGTTNQCNCPDGFRGQACEYLDSDIIPGTTSGEGDPVEVQDDDDKGDGSASNGGVIVSEGDGFTNQNNTDTSTSTVGDCNIACVHGVCRTGYKNVSEDLNQIIQNTQHMFFDSTEKEFSHCVCDDDEKWTGLLCEIPVDTCEGGDRHYCFHGGKCVENGKEQLCDCLDDEDNGNSNLASYYAGQHCEHPVHDICTTDPNPIQGQPLSFCVNGGVCKSKVSPGQIHPGCVCDQGFVGPHCEIRESATVPGNELAGKTLTSWTAEDARQRTREYNNSDNKMSTVKITILVISCFAIVGVFLYFTISYIPRRKRNYNNALTNTINWADKKKKGRGGGGSRSTNKLYRDHPTDDDVYDDVDEDNNIAPHRDSSTFELDGDNNTIFATSGSRTANNARSIIVDAVKRTGAALSSRDPMATHLAPSGLFASKNTTGISASSRLNRSTKILDGGRPAQRHQLPVSSPLSHQTQTSIVSDDDDEEDNENDDDGVVLVGDDENDDNDRYSKEFEIGGNGKDSSSSPRHHSKNHYKDGILRATKSKGTSSTAISTGDSSSSSPTRPQIYIGPPRDEDGHVLHNVDII